jgi:hypothetical protein
MYDHRKCDDEEDAARMAATVLRHLGYTQLAIGLCDMSVHEILSISALTNIARNCERVAKWARSEIKSRESKQGAS